jgi:antitoxin ParD1/3/4
MTTVAITLKDEDERFIDEAVKSGSYLTKSEVVAIALELLKGKNEALTSHRAKLKIEIAKGLLQLERGETVDFNQQSFLAEVHAGHAAASQ